MHPAHLAPRARLFWLLLNLVLGLIPSGIFFVWVERNAALPWLPIEFAWPYLYLETENILLRSLWNLSLFLAFGFLHSLLAQPGVHRVLSRWVPTQALRSFYLVVTGLGLWGVMGCWQHTGVVLWALPLGPVGLTWASLIIYWGLMSVSFSFLRRFDAFEFVGLKQLYRPASRGQRSSGTAELITSGWYGRVRHPIYFFTLLAFAAAPLMTLDRITLLLANLVYLVFAVPVEERKLVREFGPAYLKYRKEVPAVIPRLIPRADRR